ncbi:hypothetical protein HYT55_03570 [Candidatus Woesearchaeota archaeon]|nr:hypothetical protein [Candidatus Woesearchaeota archaeon]
MPISIEPERPRVNVSVNEVRRQESRQDNSFRFAEPVQAQKEQKRELVEEREDRTEAREPRAPREIHFSIRPWKVFKFFLVLVLLSGLFFTGRWSVDQNAIFDFSSQGPTAAAVAENAAEKVVPTTEEKVAPTETKEAAPVETTAEEPASDAPEVIITKYTKVALAIPSVKKDWHEDWGKITQLAITIKNNEEGTIKPAYFIMNVEGYDDFDKKVPLPTTAQTVSAGQKLEGTVNIPSGFAYNSVTAGDLASVHITTRLYDAKDVLITGYETDFNLQG